MAQSYKTIKEDFVSNLSGGSVLEVSHVTLVAPAAYLLWSTLQSRRKLFIAYGPIEFAVDCLLNVFCLLSAVTIYSSIPTILNILLLLPAIFIYVTPPKKDAKQVAKPAVSKEEENGSPNPLPARPFITAYRGGMMIITCIAILAVDFRVFPRRFAKVETWGTSLMDMGVGSFVFSAGLVSARSVIQARLSGKTSSVLSLLLASLRVSIPLLVLGFVRLYSVKGLDYAEHVTEYGVHWNFFFTLAFIPPLSALFQPLSAHVPAFALTAVIGAIYEEVLQKTELKAYILTAPRVDLFSQNREGIFSFPGYLLIFLIGQGLGLQILPSKPTQVLKKLSTENQSTHLFVQLIANTALWTFSFCFCTFYQYGLGLEVSRRLANLSYICWVAAYNCSQLLMFYIVEQLCFPGVLLAKDKITEKREISRANSRVLKSFNRNSLPIFLLANLLTGFVNLTVDTISMSRLGSMSILTVYCLTLTGAAVALDSYDLSIKM